MIVFSRQIGRWSRVSNEKAFKKVWTWVGRVKNEVVLIAKLQHHNLVKHLGCCIQGEEKILIYEYMPNKAWTTLFLVGAFFTISKQFVAILIFLIYSLCRYIYYKWYSKHVCLVD